MQKNGTDNVVNKRNKCQEHEDVTCKLAERYPYCDMTCPINRYSDKKFESRAGND